MLPLDGRRKGRRNSIASTHFRAGPWPEIEDKALSPMLTAQQERNVRHHVQNLMLHFFPFFPLLFSSFLPGKHSKVFFLFSRSSRPFPRFSSNHQECTSLPYPCILEYRKTVSPSSPFENSQLSRETEKEEWEEDGFFCPAHISGAEAMY